jgi:hypothetical protein
MAQEPFRQPSFDDVCVCDVWVVSVNYTLTSSVSSSTVIVSPGVTLTVDVGAELVCGYLLNNGNIINNGQITTDMVAAMPIQTTTASESFRSVTSPDVLETAPNVFGGYSNPDLLATVPSGIISKEPFRQPVSSEVLAEYE